MRLTIEMHDPEGTILSEIADKRMPRKTVAITYAFLMAQKGGAADWPKINIAIRERWSPSALDWIKKKAWKIVADWRSKAEVA